MNQTPDEQAFASQAGGLLHQVPERAICASPAPGTTQPAAASRPCRRPRTAPAARSSGRPAPCCSSTARTRSRPLNIWTADARSADLASNRFSGNLPEEPAVGQLPVYQSVWDEYEANPPDWMTDLGLCDQGGLGAAQAIAPTILAITQFDIAAPFYSAYLSGEESDAKTA